MSGGDPGELEVLDEATCWELFRSQLIGRLAVNRPHLSPLVLPVNFGVEDDDQVVIRTAAGAKLDFAPYGLVAIEVDEIDPVHHVGWSVVVEGMARALYEDEEQTPIDTWAPGPRPYVIRIRPTHITGRRIRLATPDTDERGYR